MVGANMHGHLRDFPVGALLTWTLLDFGGKSRFKKFTQREQLLF